MRGFQGSRASGLKTLALFGGEKHVTNSSPWRSKPLLLRSRCRPSTRSRRRRPVLRGVLLFAKIHPQRPMPILEKGFNTVTLTDCCATTSAEGQAGATGGTFGMFSDPMTADDFVAKL